MQTIFRKTNFSWTEYQLSTATKGNPDLIRNMTLMFSSDFVVTLEFYDPFPDDSGGIWVIRNQKDRRGIEAAIVAGYLLTGAYSHLTTIFDYDKVNT